MLLFHRNFNSSISINISLIFLNFFREINPRTSGSGLRVTGLQFLYNTIYIHLLHCPGNAILPEHFVFLLKYGSTQCLR
jgi:hypothetical protein